MNLISRSRMVCHNFHNLYIHGYLDGRGWGQYEKYPFWLGFQKINVESQCYGSPFQC